jgi:hypothetical protein
MANYNNRRFGIGSISHSAAQAAALDIRHFGLPLLGYFAIAIWKSPNCRTLAASAAPLICFITVSLSK